MEYEESLPKVSHLSKDFASKDNFYLISGPFHPRSNFELAIESYELLFLKLLKARLKDLPILVIAGQFNEQDPGEREYLWKINKLIANLNCCTNIVVLKKLNAIFKKTLLTYCICVLHTTLEDIFGEQILEAMYMGRPVIAANDGVAVNYLSERCGYLVKPVPHAFACFMYKLYKNRVHSDSMGLEAKKIFVSQFSFLRFASNLSDFVEKLGQKTNDTDLEKSSN